MGPIDSGNDKEKENNSVDLSWLTKQAQGDQALAAFRELGKSVTTMYKSMVDEGMDPKTASYTVGILFGQFLGSSMKGKDS